VLALKGWGSFVLEPLAKGRTRLLARSRTPRGPATIFNALVVEIPHFVMERKMLHGLKRRAERAALRGTWATGPERRVENETIINRPVEEARAET
jgi:hypothetical protein